MAGQATHDAQENFGICVLVVEDQPLIRHSIVALLSANGYAVAEAAAGRRGLGSGTLDQLTSGWHLETTPTGSRLSANVGVGHAAMPGTDPTRVQVLRPSGYR